MNIINIVKQKIFDNSKRLYAYELVFKDSDNEPTGLSSTLKGTAQLIISSISSPELDKLLLPKTLAFINVDEDTLLKGILDNLDPNRFVLNILEDIELSDKVVSKIIQYKKRGYKFSLENFDSSKEMIEKFNNILKFIDIIKMDIAASEPQNLEKVVAKFKGTSIKLLAKNIESKEEHLQYFHMGFDYFQGYYLDKPETIEIVSSKEPALFIILQLVKIIKDEESRTEQLEYFIKMHPDLSFRLVEFFNKSMNINTKIESITQVVTLMGRDKLLRWLLLYLYTEASKNAASKNILDLAVKRAERMEEEASEWNKDKAYLAGMFSMLGSIFETDIRELVHHIKLDNDITSLVLEKKGIFAGSLMRAEAAEKDYLKKLMLQNFEKLNSSDLISTLEDSGVEIDKSKL